MDGWFGGFLSLWVLIAAIPIGLVVLGIVALTNRRDDDPDGHRATAIYLGVVCFLALFTVLFSSTAAVGKAASFIVPAGDRGGVDGGWFNYEPGVGIDFDSYSPRHGGDGVPDAFLDEVDDATARSAILAVLIFLPAGAVLLFHLRRRRELVDGETFVGSAGWRTDRVYLYLVCVIALILAVIAAASALYDVVRLIAPDVTTGDPFSRRSERERAVADGITMGFLLVGSTLIFASFWGQVSGEGNLLRRSRREADDTEDDTVDG